MYFSSVFGVADETQCWNPYAILTADGPDPPSSVGLLNGPGGIPVLSGIVGSIAQWNGAMANPDFLRLDQSGMWQQVSQAHTEPPLPLVLSPLAGEGYANVCPGGWDMGVTGPTYLIKDQLVTSDVQLVAAVAASTARCFITGFIGAWSTTRSNGNLQPYAQIYRGAMNDIRMVVWPRDRLANDSGIDDDSVGAYASCIKTK